VSALAAEWVKFRTVRGWVIGMLLAGLLIALLTISLGSELVLRRHFDAVHFLHDDDQGFNLLRSKTSPPAGVMAAPMIPGLNDSEMERILELAARAGARHAGYVLLRLPHELRPLFEDWLATHVPERAGHVLSLVRQTRAGALYDARFHHRQTGHGPYAELLLRRFERAIRQWGLNEAREGLDCARFSVPGVRVADPKACQCGEVLKGVIKPWECKVFGTACTPETPIGTCMVSPEGACAAYYNYGRFTRERIRNAASADHFLVAADLSEVNSRVSDFDRALFWSFVLLGAGLLAAVLLQVRVGLRPLRRVSEALTRIRDGTARRLEGEFPAEIAPLASELNSLIEHSTEVVARARMHVSNLAHFLKTPLTVLSSEASAHPGALADAVFRQVRTMRRQIDHYLARASAAGAVDALGNRTRVEPVLDDLSRTLMRIHADRGIGIGTRCPASLFFRGERQDLEEMLGNLIDNGCKWAHTKVRVTARPEGAMFELSVEDDGAGLTEDERALVGERGERLDETVPGSGLGLSIVREIARLYGGVFLLDASAELGGLKAVLRLPLIA